ncbi:hypothetical protein CHS0354_011570 [Potamilus streckersoni]|uniref:Apple domain-containing protein n=1 Tax=Potamilus streckersoni TaxID=2493646 RepID=A0AAE0VIR7_9BIVA|nr:hypothetical protein CHS0354_011570 [Potamilus streckersoni]
MRNKEDFVCIILILLIEYALSQDTCERGTCLGQFSFRHFLPRSVFTTKYEVSPYQCATECLLRRQRCKSFNYRRSALSCQLCEEDSGPGGINLQPKAGSDHSNINTWRNVNMENLRFYYNHRYLRFVQSARRSGIYPSVSLTLKPAKS